jgi:hypothetical protein
MTDDDRARLRHEGEAKMRDEWEKDLRDGINREYKGRMRAELKNVPRKTVETARKNELSVVVDGPLQPQLRAPATDTTLVRKLVAARNWSATTAVRPTGTHKSKAKAKGKRWSSGAHRATLGDLYDPTGILSFLSRHPMALSPCSSTG